MKALYLPITRCDFRVQLFMIAKVKLAISGALQDTKYTISCKALQIDVSFVLV